MVFTFTTLILGVIGLDLDILPGTQQARIERKLPLRHSMIMISYDEGMTWGNGLEKALREASQSRIGFIEEHGH